MRSSFLVTSVLLACLGTGCVRSSTFDQRMEKIQKSFESAAETDKSHNARLTALETRFGGQPASTNQSTPSQIPAVTPPQALSYWAPISSFVPATTSSVASTPNQAMIMVCTPPAASQASVTGSTATPPAASGVTPPAVDTEPPALPEWMIALGEYHEREMKKRDERIKGIVTRLDKRDKAVDQRFETLESRVRKLEDDKKPVFSNPPIPSKKSSLPKSPPVGI